MDASIHGGSDEGYEFVCQPCERVNQYEEGVGYCVDCCEYMCSTCLACHKKSLTSRDHKLLDKASIQQHGIPTSPPPRPPKPTESKQPPPIPSKPTKLAMQSKVTNPQDPFTRKCKKHTDEFTKLYCNKHSELVCTVCLFKDHTECSKDVTYISEVSGDITQSSEFRETFTDLKRMRALLGFEHSRMIYNEKRIDEIHKSALDGSIKFKEEMIQAIEHAHNLVEKDLNKIRDEQKAGLTDWLTRYDVAIQDVENAIQNLEVNMSNGNFNQLYVDMKVVKVDLPKLQTESQRLSEENNLTKYKFEGNSDLEDMLKAVNGFGNILKTSDPTNVSANFLHEIDVKSESDKYECKIEGAVVLPDGDLAIVDNANKTVKIIDVNQKKIKTHMELESDPFDIALVEDDKIVVTLPNIEKIIFLQLGKAGLTSTKSISTKETCVGIDYQDKKLFTACQDELGCCRVMDTSGKVLKKMTEGYLGTSIFTKPRCLALSVDKSAVYITERDDGRVKLVNLKGEEIAEFELTGIKKPIGITSDEDGTVYISHGGDDAIYRLSPACEHPQRLLGPDDGLNAPWAIALDRRRHMLYVGSASAARPQCRDTIRVFQLKYDWA